MTKAQPDMTGQTDPCKLLEQAFGAGGKIAGVSAPGRVNLIGEHIDYHGLAVLPMAIGRSIRMGFRRRGDRRIRVASGAYGVREFEWTEKLAPVERGDWENYLRAAAQAVSAKWGVGGGIDAAIASDLPAAAGLSSSSALIVATTLGLLRANGYDPTFEELMEVLPEGEHFVGTRGGGMDHAASLASRPGHASLVEFEPLHVRHVPVPEDWRFVVAHSLVTAEKSGTARERYNAVRQAGAGALAKLGVRSYGEIEEDPATLIATLEDCGERDAFEHVAGEARRVADAVAAMERADAARFGALLLASHASLRDRLKVSCPELDSLVTAAMESGALGARLTGAGFGGCAVVLTTARELEDVRHGIEERFYRGLAGFDAEQHLIDALPAPGALWGGERPVHATKND